MIYGSVCSGIEAVTVAWAPLGFRPAWFAEIDPFCSALLKHHYPDVQNHGDFTAISSDAGPIDILAGGTPCPSFSCAGRRGGLDDPRGYLALEFCRLAGRLRPRWVVWENVPGVLSSNRGRDFGAILRALAELGYGCAWRVLDAQFFGVPQRRRRVFVVGHLGDWRRAAAVLFEREGLCRDTPARRKAHPGVAALTADGVGTCGADDNQAQAGHLIPFGGNNTSGPIDVATACNARGGSMRMDFETETFCVEVAPPLLAGANRTGGDRFPGTSVDTCKLLVAHTLRGEAMDASEDGTGRGVPILPVGFSCKDSGADAMEDVAPTMRAMGHRESHPNAGGQLAVAFRGLGQDGFAAREGAPPRATWVAVRRLTARECERLQGLPDNYTLIPNYRRKLRADEIDGMAAYLGIPLNEVRRLGATPDGPRYKAIGNSMAVPVMRWIGQRIQVVDGFASPSGQIINCGNPTGAPR
ncbi:MAG: DNA cytosine methyltransferase [Bryobacteraceae bacterium]